MAKHLAAVRLHEAGFRRATAPLPRAGPHPKLTKREEATCLNPTGSYVSLGFNESGACLL
jgi:hypothetical protein